MMLFLLLLAAGVLIWALFAAGKPESDTPKPPPSQAKEWLYASGMLGLAVLLSRRARVPLATLLTLLPFLVPELKRAEDAQASMPSAGGKMTPKEACLILGLEDNPAPEQIREAHRRLILKCHPDAGGNDYLASKINEARDVLLRSIS